MRKRKHRKTSRNVRIIRLLEIFREKTGIS
jgi:hypothetical protein